MNWLVWTLAASLAAFIALSPGSGFHASLSDSADASQNEFRAADTFAPPPGNGSAEAAAFRITEITQCKPNLEEPTCKQDY